MLYQYSYRLGAYAPSLDPDAKAYIAAVETALSSSISADQKNAINDFFKTGKSDGWYSSIKRLYLPIWADAAANAIDMVTRTSGTFPVPGGVTHASGYVQGNGSTGYFDMGASPSSLGLTPSSGSSFYLKYETGTGVFSRLMGARNSSSQSFSMSQSSTSHDVDYCNETAGRFIYSSSFLDGIFIYSRYAGDRRYEQRDASGFSLLQSDTVADAGIIPTLNLYALARNSGGSATNFTDHKLGLYGISLGLSATQSQNFTLALKDLWQTASGLTLP